MRNKTKAISFTKEQDALLSFISIKNREYKGQFDWQILAEESLKQGCLMCLLPVAKSNADSVPDSSMRYIMAEAGKALRLNQSIYNAESEIASAFNGKIKYVILKGTSSAAYYANPEERMTGDIDIYVDDKNVADATEILNGLGYKDSKIDNEHHLVFLRGKVLVEIHFKIAGIPEKSNERLKELLSGVFADSVKKSPFGYAVSVPGDEKQALILLLHMRHHFYIEGIGLRHLCDWANFINRTVNGPFWQDVLTLLGENGLLNFAKAFTKTCASYLRAPLPEWAKDFSERTCKKIMQEIFFSGNFGSKDVTYIDSSVFMPDENGKGKRKNFFTVCNQALLNKYPFLKRRFILYPFLAGYEGIKYIIKPVFGKKSTISSTVKSAKRREKLISEIERKK